MPDLAQILQSFGIDPTVHSAEAFGSGLIHSTYIVRQEELPVYILQRVNQHVFRNPGDISHNLHVMGRYLEVNRPGYLFTHPMLNASGDPYVISEGEYYRVFRYITGTHTVDACSRPEQAYEAANQFGSFTATMKDLRTDMLRFTIPGFHDLGWRYIQFEEAVRDGDQRRLQETRDLAAFLYQRKHIVDTYIKIREDRSFRCRVTHHDTKINNVLFDRNNRGVCVIDLDTVMPGYFISDVGDMMRTYLSPANEEERELDAITIRQDFFKAIREGYMEQMGALLSGEEHKAFLYSGKFMIYMQALRFYTDFLNNDAYYGARYEGHNLSRASNQVRLLQELEKAETELLRIH